MQSDKRGHSKTILCNNNCDVMTINYNYHESDMKNVAILKHY